eukprot:GILK01013715.1.p1 GENE.GILK01013715.1~~GILK01013715.1.p1  ORF type:complete len:679 (+),score=127.77 GILK01013715.1:39-2039(+)
MSASQLAADRSRASRSVSPQKTREIQPPQYAKTKTKTKEEHDETVVDTLCGSVNEPGYKDGTRDVAKFDAPSDLLLSPDGTKLYVAELSNHCIREITLPTTEAEAYSIMTLCGDTTYGFKDGAARDASFSFPHGLALLHEKLYVADTSNHAIRQVDIHTGHVETVIGHKRERGQVCGNFEEVRFNEPRGLVADGESRLFVTDSTALFVVDLTSRTVRKVAGGERKGHKDGSLVDSLLNHPDGVVLLSGGILFIADSHNHCIRVVDMEDSVISTFAGTGEVGHRDGELGQALFKYPMKLALDLKRKRLFVTELNDCVRMIDLVKRNVCTVAGKLVSGFADGSGSVSMFNFPLGIAVDPINTNLYIADSDNNTIRKIKLSSKVGKTVTDIRRLNGQQRQFQGALKLLMDSVSLSARNISSSVWEVVQSYQRRHTPEGYKTLLEALAVAVNRTTKLETDDEQVQFIFSAELREQIMRAKPDQLGISELTQLSRLLTQLNRCDIVKLPGLRVVASWLTEFEKAAKYFHEHSAMKTSTSNWRKRSPPRSKINSSLNTISTVISPDSSTVTLNETETNVELNGSTHLESNGIDSSEICVRCKCADISNTDTYIGQVIQENTSLKEQNARMERRMKQLEEEASILTKILEHILDDDSIRIPALNDQFLSLFKQ